MKLLLSLSAAAVLATAALSVSAAPAEVSHFIGKGDYASFSAWDDGGETSVYVYRGGTPQNQTTYLNYYASSCTYSEESFSCTGSSAWGLIPNASFHVLGQSGAADLTADSSSLSGWAYSYSCDSITWTCSYQDLPLSSGEIDVHWDRSTMYSYTTDSRTETDYINAKVSSHNKSTYSSSSVEANVFGVSYSSDYGQIGKSQSVDHQVIKN
jgi:hypothetical protein